MVTLRDKARKRFGHLVQGRPLVQPGKEELKSGCRWCSLLPWSHDFDKLSSGFNLDAEKIRARESEKHIVKTRCVEEPKWSPVDILFVGEAPGGDEDREGVPFIGRSGKLLREAIGAFSRVRPEQCGITNTVRCRPPRNRTPNKTEIRGCHPRLMAEIAKRKPKILVALGNVPLEALTGNTGITKYNARVMPCVLPGFEDVLVVGCFHPAYVLRADFEMERFIVALETAQAALHGEIEDKGGRGTYTVVNKLSDLKALMLRLMQAKLVAVDTETGALSPFQSVFPRLLCVSFSDAFGKGWTVPIDHAESPWRVGGKREDQRATALKLISRFITSDVPKVLQSGKFDALHLRAALGVRLRNYRDTFLDHIVTDETRGTHGLDQLAWTYTGMGGYDKPLADHVKSNREANPEKGGSYANIPGPLLFDYAAMDADVTFRVAMEFEKDPAFQKNERLQLLSRKFLISLSEALTDLEFEGAQVDTDQVAVLDKKYRAEMARDEKAIHSLKRVRRYESARSTEKGESHTFNPGSSQQLQDVLFGLYGERPVELTDKGLETLQIRYTRSVVSWRKKRKGLRPEFRRTVKKAIEKQEWKLFSTKADVLHEIARRGNELAPLILSWRSAETLHKTFVSPLSELLDSNKRVHGTYNIGGTVTGRLSSSNPNLQNIPNKGGGLIKRAYVSRFGHDGVLGQVDYSQIELRVAACWFREPTMVKAYREGADLHLLTALDISRMTLAEYEALDPHKAKEIRTQAKRVNFGVLYGGGPPALMSALKKDGVFLTLDECADLIRRYFAARPKLKEGIEKLEAEVRQRGFLESFTGRRRHIPEVFSENEEIVARALRQSVNFPIQCGASEMTLMSLVLIWREMRRRRYRSRMILTVHDSLVFDLHVDEAFEVLALAKHTMENLPRLSDAVLPGLDWSWLNVPLVADCDVGQTWGTTVDVKNPLEPDVEALWVKMAEKVA